MLKSKYLSLITVLLFISLNLSAQQSLETTTEAVQKYQAGKTEEAINLLKLTIASNPEYIDAKLILGQIYIETAQFENAKTVLNECAEIADDNAEVHYSLGVTYFNLEDFENALDQFKRTKKLNPKHENLSELSSVCYLNLGVIEYRKNRKKKAKEYFRKAVESDGQNIQAFKNLAVTLYETGKKEEAIEAIQKALKVSPKEKTLLKILTQVYADKNKPEEAQKIAEKYYKYFPEDIDGALQLAYLYRFNNQGDKAFAIYERALKTAPNDQRIYDDYAELYKYRGKFDKAASVYERALKRLPNKAEIYGKIAGIYETAEKYGDARREYRNALLAKGDSSTIYLKIAETYLAEKNKKSAVAVLKEGLEKLPENWELLRKLGAAFEDSSEAEAIDVYLRMKKLRPSDTYPYIRLCAVYDKNNLSEFACQSCRKAIDLGAAEPTPYHIYAKLKLAKRDTLAFWKNETASIEKSLMKISKYQTKYLSQLKEGERKFNDENILQIKKDNQEMEETQNLLKESLEFLSSVSKPEVFIDQIKLWRKDYPKNPRLLEYLGKSLERENDNESALAVYEDLIKLDPEVIEGHLGMARILESEGKLDEAILAYKRALTIDAEREDIYRKLLNLNRATDNLNRLIDDWLLLAKREKENIVLLSHLAEALKMENRTEELKIVKAKMKEINSGENGEGESNIQVISK
ncbi:MAG: tetratricopeptide repeat protein [Chlorobi bacterium]|nr:tetratricopeptide repeat protein [Chlorobiota bacterium]